MKTYTKKDTGGIQISKAIKFHESRCLGCKETFLLSNNYNMDPKHSYCPECFQLYCTENIDGTIRLKDEKWEADKSYKNELEAPTHRGKTRTNL